MNTKRGDGKTLVQLERAKEEWITHLSSAHAWAYMYSIMFPTVHT